MTRTRKRRRRPGRPRPTWEENRRGRLTPIPYVMVGGMLVAAAIGIWRLNTGSDGAVDGDGLTAYRIVYRAEDRVNDPPVVTWEERVVERPFRGRSVTFGRRPSPGEIPTRGTLSADRHVYAYRDDGLHRLAGRVPGLGAGDQALSVVLDAAVERGLARRLGQREVLGRSCRDYRLAEPPTRQLVPLGDTGQHDDVCVDDDGLVLREEWTLDGKVVLVRLAVDVDLSPSRSLLRRALSTDGARPSADAARTPSVEPLTGVDLTRFAAPAGFRLADAVRFIVPPGFGSPDAPASGVDAWVFSRGRHIIAVETGSGPPPWSAEERGPLVAVGRFGSARSALGPDGHELHVEPGDGSWLRLRGTVPQARLAAYLSG